MEHEDDGRAAAGQWFLRAMADQSARAHDFDRRMRWFWLRWLLTDRSPEAALDVVAVPEAVTPSSAPAAPHRRG